MAPRSLWLQEALAAEDGVDSSELVEAIRADVCVVGGGYTGLWTALRIAELEPGASIALVEADICGGGPSGRNGGFALSWWPKVETLIKRVGEEEAFRLVRISVAGGRRAGRLLRARGDRRALPPRRLALDGDLARSARVVGGRRRRPRRAPASGRSRSSPPRRCSARTGSPVHLGAAYEAGRGDRAAGAARARPAARRRASGASASSSTRRWSSSTGSAGVVRTRAGSVQAGAIVLSMGAWLAGIPELKRAVVPVSSDIVATAPMPERLEEAGWSGGESISNCRLMVHYYRTTQDGRIAFGQGGHRHAYGGRVDDELFALQRFGRATAEPGSRRLVPYAEGVDVTHAWGGPIDRTIDGAPIFGRLPGSVPIVYGGGYSGNGVAPTLTAGKILASSALGREDEWSGAGLNRGVAGRFPPEPIRFLGGFVVRAAVKRKESREDVGRSVDPLTRRVAGLAPQGFFRIMR